jgi:hypothetical protein
MLKKGGSLMSSSSLIRLAGLVAIGSGVLGVMGDLLALVVDLDSPLSATTAPYAIVFLVYLISAALLVLGLVGLYISQSQAVGTLGLAGFLLAFLGTVLLAGAFWFELFVTPALAAQAPELFAADLGVLGYTSMFLFATVGWVLFGVATLRAGVYPRWAAILLMVGGAIAFLPLPLRGIIFFVTVAYLGSLLFTGQAPLEEQPSSRVTRA